MDIFEQVADGVLTGNPGKVEESVKQLLDSDADPEAILNKGLFSGMNEVGRLFKAEEYFIPQVLISAKAMHGGLNILEPYLAKKGVKKIGTVVIGTVKGDLHDIGKNLIGMMLKGAGFEVVDIGVDVSSEKFIEAAKEHNANIVAMSALLTTTMAAMSTVIDAFKEAGLEGKVKTLIGGCCVSQHFADKIGASGYAESAGTVVDKAKEMLGLS